MVILVEDLISAHKIAAAGFTAIPLFGTRLHNCHIYFLQSDPRPVVMWLDKDKEFYVKRYSIKISSLINKVVKTISTEKDPKCLSLERIRTLINSL